MPGAKSKSTTVVPVRLPNKVVEVLKRRADKGHYSGVSAMLRERIIYDTERRHGHGARVK